MPVKIIGCPLVARVTDWLIVDVSKVYYYLIIQLIRNDIESGQKEPSVAGSIGPYGACQADMSEYTGNYVDSMSEEDFMEWHRPRLELLLETGVDYLAIETFPALMEAKAVLKLLHQVAPDVPAWISFSCKVSCKIVSHLQLIVYLRFIFFLRSFRMDRNCVMEKP